MANELVHVPFHGDVIEAAQDEAGKVWVPIKRPCENLGIAPNNQIEKLKVAPWAVNMKIISTGSDGKSYEMFALRLDCFPMWLATIHTNKVKSRVREKLAIYQKEAAEVLANHFLGGKPKREAAPVETDPILAQLQVIAQLRQNQIEQECRLQKVESKTKEVGELVRDVEGTVKELVENRDEATRQLYKIERPSQPVPEMTPRLKVSAIVRQYVEKTDVKYQDVWNDLYWELKYRCSFDAKTRAKNSGKSPIAEVESAGLMTDLLLIASKLLD